MRGVPPGPPGLSFDSKTIQVLSPDHAKYRLRLRSLPHLKTQTTNHRGIQPAGPCLQAPTCHGETTDTPGQPVHHRRACRGRSQLERYQRMVAAYCGADRTKWWELMQAVIDSLSSGVPAALTDLTSLGRALKRQTCWLTGLYLGSRGMVCCKALQLELSL